MSVISKILLKKEHNISSTSRDVIMKPILYQVDINYLKAVMNEWQALIMDTYKKLKKESNIKSNHASHNLDAVSTASQPGHSRSQSS